MDEDELWVLDLPFATPLTLNQRMHYMVKAKRTKEYREAANVLAKAAKIPECKKIRVTLVYTPRDRRRRDALNLVATAKACEDGLVDAGVVPDDTAEYVHSQMPIIDLPNSKNPKLQLYVERVL